MKTARPLGQHWVKLDRSVYNKFDAEWITMKVPAMGEYGESTLVLCNAYSTVDDETGEHKHEFEPVKRGTLTVLTERNIME